MKTAYLRVSFAFYCLVSTSLKGNDRDCTLTETHAAPPLHRAPPKLLAHAPTTTETTPLLLPVSSYISTLPTPPSSKSESHASPVMPLRPFPSILRPPQHPSLVSIHPHLRGQSHEASCLGGSQGGSPGDADVRECKRWVSWMERGDKGRWAGRMEM